MAGGTGGGWTGAVRPCAHLGESLRSQTARNTQTSNELSVLKPTAECCARLDGLLSPEFFKALGDPRRQAILLELATSGGTWTVSRVAEALPIDISVVSRHLAQLRDKLL